MHVLNLLFACLGYPTCFYYYDHLVNFTFLNILLRLPSYSQTRFDHSSFQPLFFFLSSFEQGLGNIVYQHHILACYLTPSILRPIDSLRRIILE